MREVVSKHLEPDVKRKLDVNSGVFTMNMWVCLDETGPGFQLAGPMHGIGTISKLVRMVTMRKSDKEKCGKNTSARRALVTSDTDDVCVLNELTESEDTAMEAEPEDDEDEFLVEPTE